MSELQARPAEPAPDPAAEAQIAELESQLEAVLAERSALSQSLNGLQSRQADPAPDPVAVDRVSELETHANAALSALGELETAVAVGASRVAELEAELAVLRERAEQPQEAEAPQEATSAPAHLLFVPSVSGYTLVGFEGPHPASGTLLDVDGVSHVVRRVGASPFPGDRLRCVYLDAV